jgi:hypothetical protein
VVDRKQIVIVQGNECVYPGRERWVQVARALECRQQGNTRIVMMALGSRRYFRSRDSSAATEKRASSKDLLSALARSATLPVLKLNDAPQYPMQAKAISTIAKAKDAILSL